MKSVMISDDYSEYLRNLKKLIVKVDLLNVNSSIKEDKKRIVNNLKDLYNKMYLFQLYKDKMLIAVTGFQGAGKTTLVREYFNLPEKILPENNSRGEKLPIFISSEEVENVEAYFYKSELIEGDIKIIEEKLNIKEVANVSMNPEDKNGLWIKLKIPKNQARIKNTNTSIVLLPGYEKLSTDFSQKLLDFVVNVSASSIVVADKNSIARKSTNDILNKINEKFEDLKPIFAITHGDEKPEQNESVKKEVITTLNIENPDRVIITGLGDDWKEQITKNLESYGEIGSEIYDASQDSRKNSMQDILGDIDFEIEELQEKIEDMEKNLDIEKMLKSKDSTADQFRKEYEKYLEKLEKNLTIQMSNYKETKGRELIHLVEKHTGFFKNFKVRIIGQNIRKEQNFISDIKELWNNRNEAKLNALDVINNSSTHLLKDYNDIYKIPENNNETLENKGNHSLVKINNYFEDNQAENSIVPLDNHDIKGLVFLGASFLTNAFKIMEEEKNQNIIEEYSNEVIIKENQNQAKSDDNLKITVLDSSIVNEANEKEKATYEMLGKNLVKVMPIVLGIDVISDGKLDTIDNANNGLQQASASLGAIGINISSRALLSVAGGAFVIATTSYAIKQNIQDLNKRQMNLYNNASLFIDALAQSQVSNYVESLRNTFEKMEEKLRYRHLQLMNSNEKLADIKSCQYLMSKIKKQTNIKLERSYDEKLLF